MLRVLTLSSLFPDAARPSFGIFVERQTLGLAALEGIEVEVAAPVGLPPWPLSLHPHYRGRRNLPERESWKGLGVHRPRFRVLPGIAAGSGRELAKGLRDLVREIDPDVIDAEFFWPDGVAAMHLCDALGIPFTIKARGSDIHYWGRQAAVAPQMLRAAESASALLAVSAALKLDMAALGMAEAKIRVHHTGVDLDRFRPVDRARAKAALGVAGPLIVSAGALIPIKGQRLALEAVRGVPGATLILAGDGPERAALERAARELGIAERVRFLGNRPHDELPGLLAAADVMVLPSEREGLANVWVESLACGTPIVISDVGGAREVVDRPEAGRLVPRDPRGIAAAIRAILDDPPAAEAVRASARRFSWDANAAALGEVLAEAAGSRRAASAPRRSSAPRS
jgi:teichuronic acid biosynthesis glycosyltransferase TuaC